MNDEYEIEEEDIWWRRMVIERSWMKDDLKEL